MQGKMHILVLALAVAFVTCLSLGNGSNIAYAGVCSPTAVLGNYVCSGPADSSVDVVQSLNGAPLTVTTLPGFGIDTSSALMLPIAGDAISLTSTGGLTFIDNFNSAITGSFRGLVARNDDAGALNLITTGQVTGIRYIGIDAVNFGTDLVISAAAVSSLAGATAILANNNGTGDTIINADGHVNGGIGAFQGLNQYAGIGSNVLIHATSVTGINEIAIKATNGGTGSTSIVATGPVRTEAGYSGIEADTSGTDLTITVVDVDGGDEGIAAISTGTGKLSVKATGAVTGLFGSGIRAVNSHGTDLDITAVNVAGLQYGISATNHGTGGTSLNVSGAVSGGSSYGIYTVTGIGKLSEINLNNGALVTSASGDALFNDTGNSTTSVHSGASVTGAIRLGDGSDDLTFDGGDFAGVSVFDGGDDSTESDGFIDTLTFRNVSESVTGGNLLNWENVVIGSGAALSFGDNMLAAGNLSVVDGGVFDLQNALAETMSLTSDLAVANGGTLAFDIFSDSLFDVMMASGALDFGLSSLLDINFSSQPFDLYDGFSVSFLSATGGITGFANLGFNFSGLLPIYAANVAQTGNSLTLTLDRRVPVPEPASLALTGVGLLGLAGLAARRRKTV